ncbi:hypothetical protein F5887DRAFT_1086605 [Amanita rubescens]|nr:hypothetical protein F5887DRAFT_1086605 [Amanita rubescens]
MLEDAGERHLIALLEAGIDEGMRIDGGDSIEERKRELLRARERGLDVLWSLLRNGLWIRLSRFVPFPVVFSKSYSPQLQQYL